MKKLNVSFLLVPMFLMLSSRALVPCTTFCFPADGHWVFGRNYDWAVPHCRIMINKRGVSKRGFSSGPVAEWTSSYGSVTFNQYGREFPLGGMNESGLVVECMWLEATELPHVDFRPELNSLQWIQYQLDTAVSVADIVASDKRIRISPTFAQPLHFLACDAQGHAAVIEFLGGRMVVYREDELPTTVLTNNSYGHSVGLLNMVKGVEDGAAYLGANDSLQRFVRAARGVRDWRDSGKGNAVDYAFEILKGVTIERTVFSVVYDPGGKRIHFFTRAARERRFLRIDGFDFSCNTPVKILDAADNLKGDVTNRFRDYSEIANMELVKKSFFETDFLKDTPERILKMLAGFPQTFACVETAASR